MDQLRIPDLAGKAVLVTGASTGIGAAVAKAAERFGRLDGLVNNAGALVKRTPIEEVTDEFYDTVLDLNVRSVVAACRAAIPIMRRQGGGVIVNTSSIAARNGGGPGSGLYSY